MKKVLISQPLENKKIEEINSVRQKAVEYLESQGYEVVNKTFENEPNSSYSELKIVGENIQKIAECDSIYFVEGWSLAKNCRVERIASLLYNIEIINNKEEDKNGRLN